MANKRMRQARGFARSRRRVFFHQRRGQIKDDTTTEKKIVESEKLEKHTVFDYVVATTLLVLIGWIVIRGSSPVPHVEDMRRGLEAISRVVDARHNVALVKNPDASIRIDTTLPTGVVVSMRATKKEKEGTASHPKSTTKCRLIWTTKGEEIVCGK